MRSVLITGGTGAFGTAFAERLLKDGLATRVCIYARNEWNMAQMQTRFRDERLRFFLGCVRDRERLVAACRGVDCVVHAAALKRIENSQYNPDQMLATNLWGSQNVVAAATQAGVEKVVGLSSDKAYNPVSLYGTTKLAMEQLFLASNNTRGKHGPKFAVTRYGNVWRSTGSVVPVWEQYVEDGAEVVPISDPDVTRFFMRMSEAVDLVLKTLEQMPNEVAIPTLPAWRLGDLAQAMGLRTVTVGLDPTREKMHENMDEYKSSQFARRMSVDELRAEL